MWLHWLCDSMTGKNQEAWKSRKIVGTVELMKKDVLDHSDFIPSMVDAAHELLGSSVSCQLISSTHGDGASKKGKVGNEANLKESITSLKSRADGISKFKIDFEWDPNQGIPGGVIVKNYHDDEFFLKTLTLEGVPGKGKVHFICNSWIYPKNKFKYDRIFFTNETYLPSKMPKSLRPYREQELIHLRGDRDDISRKLEEHDRIYDYAFYNDLGDRPVLGGSHYPYPRRGRTSRGTAEDSNYERRLNPVDSLKVYVPRDERFGHLKLSDFAAYGLKSVGHFLFSEVKAFDLTPNEFDELKDTFDLYEGGKPLPHLKMLVEKLREKIPFEFFKELFRTEGDEFSGFPTPHVIKEDKMAWSTDEEFAREMLAGVNPVIIRCLEEFPPKSKLDPTVYGDQTSTIKESDILKNLEPGFTVLKALREKRLFILDYHDVFMPHLLKINALKGNYIYATRTLLFLKNDGTLKLLAIELSPPHPDGLQHGPKSTVYTPAASGVEKSIWQLAKAYVAVNDSGYHNLISHWLNTHAVIEPFIIATHRQLSVTHPIHKLMSPHYRDTMNINALARQLLVCANGIVELTVFPREYGLRMSSDVYKSWKLTEQGLPDDLIKRGVAVKDPSSKYKLQLLIKDYPYAVDGLAVWSAIESWVNEYCSLYYRNDWAVKSDVELQAWWKEIREVGHGDKKDEDWWPKMHTVKELTETCTIIIWIASALHAAVNFGQYPYAGYPPNRPTVSRRPMPEGKKELEELEKNFEKVFLKTITSQFEAILGISLLEALSKHTSDEVYLGQRDTPEWTSDEKALDAFGRFRERLVGIEQEINRLNNDENLKNRKGPVNFPYTLLYPNTSKETDNIGLVPKGIPNSVSI